MTQAPGKAAGSAPTATRGAGAWAPWGWPSAGRPAAAWGSAAAVLAAAPRMTGGADRLPTCVAGPSRAGLLAGSRWSLAERRTPSGGRLGGGVAGGGAPGASGSLSICVRVDLTLTLLFILWSR